MMQVMDIEVKKRRVRRREADKYILGLFVVLLKITYYISNINIFLNSLNEV